MLPNNFFYGGRRYLVIPRPDRKIKHDSLPFPVEIVYIADGGHLNYVLIDLYSDQKVSVALFNVQINTFASNLDM